MIRFSCPHCARRLRVEDSLAGTSAKCPACGKQFTVPSQELLPAVRPGDDDEAGDLIVYTGKQLKEMAVSAAHGAKRSSAFAANVTARSAVAFGHGSARIVRAVATAVTPVPKPTIVPPAIPQAVPLPANQQPVTVIIQNAQHNVAAVPRQGNGAATFALCMAAMTLGFAWMPFLGLLAIPFALGTMCLAGLALLIALTRDGAGGVAAFSAGVIAAFSIWLSLASTGAATKGIGESLQATPPPAEAMP